MSRRADHVPVRTEGSGTRYDGRVWYELVTSIKTVNGVAVVDIEAPLDKASLKHGDKVTLEFEGKCYSGEIDLEHSSPPESPRKKQQVSRKSLSDSGACSPCTWKRFIQLRARGSIHLQPQVFQNKRSRGSLLKKAGVYTLCI